MSHNNAPARAHVVNSTPIFMTPGRIAYEADMRRCPFYHDNAPRRTWEQLSPEARWSWERNPTPRD